MRQASYSSAGLDGIWGSVDDVPDYHVDCAFDTKGDKTHESYYGAAGADGIWFTADDVSNGAVVYTYDAKRQPDAPDPLLFCRYRSSLVHGR